MKKNRIIVSLGGSLIVPGEIDEKFLLGFKKLVDKSLKLGKKFIFITGGGRTSRRYIDTARNLGTLNPDDLDWLGIHSTRLNGHLLRTIFRHQALRVIITDPHKPQSSKYPIIIAAGYRPGFSTDYDAVVLAGHYGSQTVLNLSNVDYVYTKDPRKHKNAKPITNISWKEFRKIVGNKWDPGLSMPFDPVASKLAEKLRLRVVIMNGKNFKNIENFLSGKSFIGTVIE